MIFGKTENYIKNELNNNTTIIFALIDSENINQKKAVEISIKVEKCGVKAILVGGSTIIDQLELNDIVKSIKKVVNIPVILFPGNITGISPYADAIFFSSLLNSENPYFITGAQALGALAIKKYNIEALPMGYLIIGEGGTVGFVGKARGIPYNKPNLAMMYALAAQYLGMRFLYMEAGSGVTSHIPFEFINKVKALYNGILIIGGGITDSDISIDIARSGADIIVLGSLLEKINDFEETLKNIVNNTKNLR